MPMLPSMRTRFALLIALLVGALSWMMGTLIGEHSSRQIRQDVGRELAEMSYAMADRLDRDMAGRAAVLRVLSNLQALRQPDDLDEIRRLFSSLQQEIPSIAWIGLTDPAGQVLASGNGLLERTSIAQRPVYQQALNGLFIGDVHEAVLLSKLLPNPTGEAMKFVDISLPIHDDKDNLVAVLASHLSWGWADEVQKALLAPVQDRRQVEFFVISQQGSVLLGPPDTIGQTLPLAARADLEPGKSRWAVQTWPDGVEYLTGLTLSQGFADYPGLGWTIAVRQPLDLAYAPSRELMFNILLWGCGLALLFAFAGWVLSGYFTYPLRQIAKAADSLSAGEINEIPEFNNTREISQLSHSIRHLVETLTMQKRALDAMENLSHQDPLTGLPNRLALEKYLPQARQRSRLQQGCLALLYLDLDGFRQVNDDIGHNVGDHLLRESAQRLRQCLRDGDMVARLGGDEFLMILQVPQQDAQHQTRLVAERAIAILSQPFELEAGPVSISCSIGGAIWPLDHVDLGEALELADQALTRAKHKGRQHLEFYKGADFRP